MLALEIVGLKIHTIIGIHPFEKQIEQPLLIDITLPIDSLPKDDDIATVLDYDALSKAVMAFFQTHRFELIETALNQLNEFIIQTYHVTPSYLAIGKPLALKAASMVRVVMQREL